MRQTRSGWLTIHPSGRWYFQPNRDSRNLLMGSKRKTAIGSLGPFSIKKRIILGTPPAHSGKIRTKIHWTLLGNHFLLGPIIGILTASEGPMFCGNKENFKDIILSGKRLGALVYVFTPNGIDWEAMKVRGFLYHPKQNQWVKHTLPFPHVVYNRIPTRKLERQQKVKQTLNLISSLENVTLFNRRFFNKQVLFKTLEKCEEVSHLLPETKKLDSLTRLKVYCSRYPFVYLKPVRGKAGKGIMRLDRIANLWRVRRVLDQKAVTRHFATLGQVWNYVKKQTKGKPYIIQQGIVLARYRGRPFDVRVLVQKNGTGEWGITGVGIRRAGAGSITTHVPRGGSIQSTKRVLSHLFGDQAEKIRANIEKTALSLARALDREIDNLAEMSMDLGLTAEGKLWFFEANAKPEKFDEPSIRRSSLANLIRYSQYASRLGSKEMVS